MAEEFHNQVSNAFSSQSSSFDELEKENILLQWMRNQVYRHLSSLLHPGQRLLELNSGTGTDAVYFARQGVHVLATDISGGMISEIKKKITAGNLEDRISLLQSSFTDLSGIKEKNFDHIFSNFGGLNCTAELDRVIHSFSSFLKPGGMATLVIMPPVCPWEILLALKGNFKTAFRRFKKKGALSHLEGFYFKTYYYSPSQVIRFFGKGYEKVSLRGLASVSPPPYLENFPKKFPRLYRSLQNWDEQVCTLFPFNAWADHFILTMRKK